MCYNNIEFNGFVVAGIRHMVNANPIIFTCTDCKQTFIYSRDYSDNDPIIIDYEADFDQAIKLISARISAK